MTVVAFVVYVLGALFHARHTGTRRYPFDLALLLTGAWPVVFLFGVCVGLIQWYQDWSEWDGKDWL